MAHGRADPAAFRWADLRTRVISGVILAPLALLVVWIGGLAWALLVLLAAILLASEWAGMCGVTLLTPAGLALAACLTAIVGLTAAHTPSTALRALPIFLALTWLAGAFGRPACPRPASVAAGTLYIGCAAIALIWLRDRAGSGRADVLFLALVIWASDVGAYVTGRLLGGPRLAPRISPGKTWAGAAGGLLAAIAVGYGAAMILTQAGASPGASWRVGGIAAGLSLAAQIGDLFESAAKRHFGVKDSGRLIPGHGGLLDRLDGFLAAAPAAALLARAVSPGGVLWQ